MSRMARVTIHHLPPETMDRIFRLLSLSEQPREKPADSFFWEEHGKSFRISFFGKNVFKKRGVSLSIQFASFSNHFIDLIKIHFLFLLTLKTRTKPYPLPPTEDGKSRRVRE